MWKVRLATSMYIVSSGGDMARKVFFSFHYERDVQRASVVRNHAVTKDGDEAAGYVDKAEWESIERQGSTAIKRWIDGQLKGTSVTVVLIGPETSSRDWVNTKHKRAMRKETAYSA